MEFTGTRKRKKTTKAGPAPKRSKLTLTKVNAKVNRLIRAQDRKKVDYAVKWSQTSPAPDILFKPTGHTVVLNTIAQGDGGSERDGNRAFIDSLLLRYHVRVRDPTLVSYRLMVVWDEGALSGISASKYLDFSAVIDGEEAMAPIRLDQNNTFKVLYDDTNGLGVGCHRQTSVSGAAVDMVTDVVCKKFIKIGTQARWEADTSTIPTSGALVLVTIGNAWASPTTTPIQNGALVSRVRYTD